MSTHFRWMLVGAILSTALILPGCDRLQSETPISGIDFPIQVGEYQVRIFEVQIHNSYSVHYIMHYPPEEMAFYRVTIHLAGFAKPQHALSWGEENFRLTRQNRTYELAHAHWELVGDQIEYKSGSDFQYRYVFIYSVPLHEDPTQLSLQIASHETIPLSSVIQVPERIGDRSDSKSAGSDADSQTVELFSTISGGSKNTSSAYHTTVGGGHLNQASVAYATVGGGRENLAVNSYTTVGGGYGNEASGRDSTVGGGSRNLASYYHATVAGGIRNQANASDATIGGGGYNRASETYATVSGGTQNEASGSGAVVGGGAGNLASNNQSTVGGGLGNQASGAYAAVGGGQGNLAGGGYSAVPGGMQNQAKGDFSFAAGRRAAVSQEHLGVFLFADAVDAVFPSEQPNEFGVRATGGVRFVTAVDRAGESVSGVVLAPGTGSWSSLSDKRAKQNFREVDQLEILEGVVSLPISEWNYKSQNSDVRHIGPMSQEFYATFGVGEDELHITSIDADGVSLAAIQALYQLIDEKDAQINHLESRLERIEAVNLFVLILLGLGWIISAVRKAQWGKVSENN